jgi:predicted deacylase
MPSVEAGMDERRLVEFRVQVGSPVVVGQPLFVVEAEKVTLEIEAPAAGRVACAGPRRPLRAGRSGGRRIQRTERRRGWR